ncbi:diguanylate cyclase (GGDEF)-like protein [Janthinobacterium sp. CG_23.3]|uniref:sensor domain-containing diguanylate cyclase n=1 Tax=Janthinobacterium sp. CG_23.3 TaxID=3349634 RepID=UPI0038D3AE30
MASLRSFVVRLANKEDDFSPIKWRATSFVVLVCVSLVVLQSWISWRGRESQLKAGTVVAANLARAVAQHAYDTVKEADTVLVGLVERLETDPPTAAQLARVQQLLVKRVAELPQLHGVFVYRSDGGWLVNSLGRTPKNASNAEREYFIYHRTHLDRGPHIGPLIRSKSTGDLVITVSRRLNRPDSSFGGVALATIRMEYFQSFYERFEIGRSGAIFVALDNGTLLVRRPFERKSLGRNIAGLPLFGQYLPRAPVGTAIITSGQDGITRINSYRRLEQYPLVVSAALAQDEVLGEWRADAHVYGVGVGVLVLVLGLLGVRLVRQIELRGRTEAELVLARNSLESLNVTLQRLAMQDGLTGLANRRQFDVSLQDEFSRAMRNASSLALIMIDVDCFKQYNDLFGHPAGDECLRAIGQVINAGKRRAGDVVARYGGEEIAVLLPATEMAGAMQVAESIRKAIHALQLRHPGNGSGVVTVSAGVQALVPVRNDSRPLDLVEAADRAMYRAKQSGRNQVCGQASRLCPALAAGG